MDDLQYAKVELASRRQEELIEKEERETREALWKSSPTGKAVSGVVSTFGAVAGSAAREFKGMATKRKEKLSNAPRQSQAQAPTGRMMLDRHLGGGSARAQAPASRMPLWVEEQGKHRKMPGWMG
jgi:hypothetical protein